MRPTEPHRRAFGLRALLPPACAGRFKEAAAQFETDLEVNSRDIEETLWRIMAVAADADLETARKAVAPVRRRRPRAPRAAPTARPALNPLRSRRGACFVPRQVLEAAKPSDTRVPMRELLELFAGRGTPEQVLLAAQGGPAHRPLSRTHTRCSPRPAARPFPPARAVEDHGASAGTLENQMFYAHYYLGAYYEAAKDYAKALTYMRQALRFRTSDYMGGLAKVHERVLVARAGSAALEVTNRRTVAALPPVLADEPTHVTLADGYSFPRVIRGAGRELRHRRVRGGGGHRSPTQRAPTVRAAWAGVAGRCRVLAAEQRPPADEGPRERRSRRGLCALHGGRPDGRRLGRRDRQRPGDARPVHPGPPRGRRGCRRARAHRAGARPRTSRRSLSPLRARGCAQPDRPRAFCAPGKLG